MSKRALYIKPQYLLRKHLGDYWTLTSENKHEVLDQTTAEFMTRIEKGLDIADLNENEMPLLSRVNDLGYVEIRDAESVPPLTAQPFWELVGYKWQTLTAQNHHLTYNLLCDTDLLDVLNRVKGLVAPTIGEPSADCRLVVFITDSLKRARVINNRPTLILVANRLNISAGPVLFPWSSSGTLSRLQGGLEYVDAVQYKLTVDLVAMQDAWLASVIIKTVLALDLKFVGHKNNYNLLTHVVS